MDAFREHDRDGADAKAERQDWNAEPQRPFPQVSPSIVALDGTRRQITGDEEKEPHEKGLVDRAKEYQQRSRRRPVRFDLVIVPAAYRAVGDRGVMEQHEQRERRT